MTLLNRSPVLLAAALLATGAQARQAVLFDGRHVAGIVHDVEPSARLAGELLGRDLRQLTGRAPRVSGRLEDCRRLCVVVGRHDSALLRAVAADSGADLGGLSGQWERYVRVLVRSRRDPGTCYLVIAGSDQRGAVWGVVDLTRELGVSAWEWWADVTLRRVERLSIGGARRLSVAPSVRYRGIFLNDEDWGLQPWAAKTFEPETGDIGPKTYARIFELMWRLKANLIWPAMHDSTKPFYQIPGNAETARDYGIVVGTSHAEPMMRNNVREWDDKTRGEFNFFNNRDALVGYWRERAEEVKGFENLYTIGLRGKHDSGMEGAATSEAARDALTDVIAIQRDLLGRSRNRPAGQVPQALTLYKEVLDVYSTGLKVPDDVTLIWPEDNYGYISRLPTPAEQARGGGSGVYYHLSYWGRPHDYLWLATTHPALVREQMGRAWDMNARRIWVANVGDIKPAEYLTQYFLDLAFDHRLLEQPARAHLRGWLARQFGEAGADELAAVMTGYYDLAFERRPEFMGFSQVEPVTPIRTSDYVRGGGAAAHARIDRYADLMRRADAAAARMPADRRDAFFQLIGYPVRGAANINARNLKLDLAGLYARQGRANVNAYAEQARTAHAAIVADTAAYNRQRGGKWRGIMNMAPRGLPVFAEPAYPRIALPSAPGCAVQGGDMEFTAGAPATRTFTVYTNGRPAHWSAVGVRGLRLAATTGELNAANGYEQRVAVRFDGQGAVRGGTVTCQGTAAKLAARVRPAARPGAPVERARVVTFGAADAVAGRAGAWQTVPGLGSQGSALRAPLALRSTDAPAAPPLDLRFTSGVEADAALRLVAVPVHELTADARLRIGVQVDNGPVAVLDYQTHGRSEAWKQTVLANSLARDVPLPVLSPGEHRVRIHPLDPGFVLDRVEVRLDGARDDYGIGASGGREQE